MYKISICDDDPDMVQEIHSLIKGFFEIMHLQCSLSLFQDSEAVMSDIDRGNLSDIYILDVIMPKTDGIELAEYIRRHDKNCFIIFITSSTDYAIHGYKVAALDYILKPIDKDELYAALMRTINRITNTGTLVIKIKNRTSYMEIDTNALMYVESSGHIVHFGMADGVVHDVVASLEQYAPLLTKYSVFLRCHKSYVVNLNFVKEKKTNYFILKNGKTINISRSKMALCKNKYHEYIFTKMKGGAD